MPSSIFAAIFGYLPGAPLKGSRESCQKPARPLLTGGAPVAAQEAPCPAALSPSLLRPPWTPCFPSGRLPAPDWRAGRMLDGIPSEAEAFFRATGLPLCGGWRRVPRRPGRDQGSFTYDDNIQDSGLRYAGAVRTEPRPYASPRGSQGQTSPAVSSTCLYSYP